MVNSYFNILVKYGDQYEVLDFEDLIEIEYHAMDINVRLRNLEYDLTRSIQKTVYGFQSLESVLARLPEPEPAVQTSRTLKIARKAGEEDRYLVYADGSDFIGELSKWSIKDILDAKAEELRQRPEERHDPTAK